MTSDWYFYDTGSCPLDNGWASGFNYYPEASFGGYATRVEASNPTVSIYFDTSRAYNRLDYYIWFTTNGDRF